MSILATLLMFFMLVAGSQLSWWKKVSGNKTTILISIKYILQAINDINVKVVLVVIFILNLVSSLKCWDCAEGSCVLDESGGNLGIEEICTSTAPVCAKQEFGKSYNNIFDSHCTILKCRDRQKQLPFTYDYFRF